MCHLPRKGTWSVLRLFSKRSKLNFFKLEDFFIWQFLIVLIGHFFTIGCMKKLVFYHYISLIIHFLPFLNLQLSEKGKINHCAWAFPSPCSGISKRDNQSYKEGACNFSFILMNYIHRAKIVDNYFLAIGLARYLAFIYLYTKILCIYLGHTFKFTDRHNYACLNVLPMHEPRIGILMYSLCTDY